MTNKEAIELLKKATMFEPTLENRDYPEAFDLAIKALKERPTGEWEEPFEMNGKSYHKCNNCHVSSQLILIDNYCPNCGAKMKGAVE